MYVSPSPSVRPEMLYDRQCCTKKDLLRVCMNIGPFFSGSSYLRPKLASWNTAVVRGSLEVLSATALLRIATFPRSLDYVAILWE